MPGLTFTVPTHHDELQSRTSHDPARDPHHLPKFSSDVAHDHPILYLPPLLSSLPESYPASEIPLHNPPLTTETRLPDIDPASLSLHRALHHFRPINGHYASNPYNEAFNWDELELPVDDGGCMHNSTCPSVSDAFTEREWYCVAFRSLRKDGSDGSREFYSRFCPLPLTLLL